MNAFAGERSIEGKPVVVACEAMVSIARTEIHPTYLTSTGRFLLRRTPSREHATPAVDLIGLETQPEHRGSFNYPEALRAYLDSLGIRVGFSPEPLMVSRMIKKDEDKGVWHDTQRIIYEINLEPGKPTEGLDKNPDLIFWDEGFANTSSAFRQIYRIHPSVPTAINMHRLRLTAVSLGFPETQVKPFFQDPDLSNPHVNRYYNETLRDEMG